jgi:dephospho-CoA kinase
MVVLGIVGGIASGKSLVSRRLAELGAEVLDADRVGHEVLFDPEVKRAIRGRWGDEVFDADGQVDRRRWRRSSSQVCQTVGRNWTIWNN